MQLSRLDYIWGCLFDAVDQVVVPGAARSNVAWAAGVALRRRWLWPFFYKKLSKKFRRSADGDSEQLPADTTVCDGSVARAGARAERTG